MDGEHIFSAAIVLVMVCIAFPHNAQDAAAMDSGLDLLRSIADRGNAHIGARHQLLVQLRSMIGTSGGVAPSVSSETDAGPHMSPGSTTSAVILPPNVGAAMPVFPLVDNMALGEIFYDLDAGDVGLWEEGYTNTDLNVEYDLTQWTQAAQNTSDDHSTM